jgi:Flp pilus assembly protein TadG
MKLWKCTKGASAVEFALVVPLLLLMLFGTIEFGRLFWTQHVLHETAISTARCMAIPQLECAQNGSADQGKVAVFARQSAQALGVLLELADVALDPATECQGLGGFSVVTLMVQFDSPLAGLVTSLAGGPLVSARACYPNYSS